MKTIERGSHKGHEGRRGRRQRALLVLTEMFSDPITRAIARDRELRRVGVPEDDTVWDHVFWCVCCGRLRGEEERREPRSSLCIRCVREAGFWN